jgi:hypothetical protein
MVVPTPDGVLNPLVLAAARRAGVTEIWRIGGAQAVAALAWGTASIAPVDRIVGPGNAYVAEAKRQVFGRVGIDSIAGPSEVVVLADGRKDPAHVAMDLLAQAEHDEAAQSILITDHADLAGAVDPRGRDALIALPRRAIAGESWARHGAVILARTGRGRRPGRPPGARASGDHAGRPARPLRQDPARGAAFLGRHTPGGDRRLRRRPEPCAAHRAQQPVRLGAVGL